MQQNPLFELPPMQSDKNSETVNKESPVVVIDMPLERLSGAMLTLANYSQLFITSHAPDALSNSALQKMAGHLSFALLETVTRTMSSYVPLRTLAPIYTVLAKTSLSKKEVQLTREILRQIELMQDFDPSDW